MHTLFQRDDFTLTDDLRVHGHEASINVRKVLWCASELGLKIELIERGTPDYPASDPAYLAINPLGRIPLLEDGEFRLAESNSIIRYLARREGRSDLIPAEPHAAAAVDQWIDWQATDFNDSWRYCFLALVRRADGYHDPELIAASLLAFDQKIAILDRQLAYSGGHVVGPNFTLADIPIGLSVRRWLALDRDTKAFPQVMAYYRRLCDRPAFMTLGGPSAPA